jgi:filamentous hemagglutinin family protein
MNSLSQATQALQAMQAAQTAAHNLALGSPPNTTAGLPAVTDGLSPGGLIVDPRVATNSNLWVNASLPVQSVSNGLTSVTINQTAPQAVLTWQQFNVGKNTVVDFNQQGNANWIALNRIDASGVPSQILGQIKADGQVMLINPNGIIFSGSSQINVHTLIASAMDISLSSTASSAGPTTYAQVPGAPSGVMAPASETADNAGFMTNGLYPFNTTLVLAASNIPGQTNVGIVVEKGASISTAVSGFDNGGYVALIGPTVTNGGSITTSAGQIILAAGGAVSITEPAANTSQTVFTVLNTSTGNALVANTGLLIAARGNITLMGDEVEQFGVAEATTSITRAGSITIGTPPTQSAFASVTSTVFGPGSVTAILPDENGETIPTNSISAFVAPSIVVSTVNMDMQPGSLIYAPSAAMTVNVGNRVLLEAGSTIDLSGLTGVTVPIAEMLYTFKVTANDVADTPLAQNLIGQTVTIDLALSGTRADGETWVGSPLFASSGAGYSGDISQSINQLLDQGRLAHCQCGSQSDASERHHHRAGVPDQYLRRLGAIYRRQSDHDATGRQ